MVNLFGKGFIGTHYDQMYDCMVNDRNDLTPKLFDILYMISTTDNYNVKINPYIDIDTNLTTLIRVLENCKGKNVVFNFCSSWFVYGDVPSPYTEDSYCNPKGFYSITKRTAEQLLISYCETYGIKYRILRFANVVGPGDKGVSTKKNALTYLIRKITKNEDIDLYDGGNFYRDYIHIQDVCRAINLVLEKGELNTIYNIGNNASTKFIDAIKYAIKKSGSTSKINHIPQADFHKIVQVKTMTMDSTKLATLGYKPQYNIDNIIDELLVDN
jgi:nucleoside-diphosphate-sugar epimerase